MSNPSGLPHAIAVKGARHELEGQDGQQGRDLPRDRHAQKKGTYTFYCPVDGHAAAGMKGKLIVS